MKKLATALSFGLLLATGFGCETEPQQESPAPFADVVSALDADLHTHLEDEAAKRAGQLGLKNLLVDDEAVKSLEVQHAATIRALYDLRDHRTAWVDPKIEVAALSTEGESLFATLLDAEDVHGLWKEDYHVDAIQSLVTRTGDPSLVPISDIALTDQERATLQGVLTQHPEFARHGASGVAAAIVRGDIPLPRLQKLVEQRSASILLVAEMKSKVDLLLSDGLIQYGLDMRWANDAYDGESVWPADLQKPRDNSAIARAELARERQNHKIYTSLRGAFESPDAIHDLVRDLPPSITPYRQLTAALQQYGEFVKDGGWSELSAEVEKLRVSSRGDDVVALKKRLSAEGYWSSDDLSDKFTKELRAAVLEYQRTHQLWEEGWVTNETRRSLNVPADCRHAQIRVTLDRWRESRIGEDSRFVHVNIPDFHAEVWENGKRQMRFKVVTGSSAREWNPRTKQNDFKHATPQISGKIEHVVFNPYWNVPDEILAKELQPKQDQNPLYFAENGFEWTTEEATGREYVRQNPGPANALGEVKFIFPNRHDVFLHDTNEKDKFKSPVRAFSHGCVRVEEPMSLAKTLLGAEEKWNDGDVASWMDRPTETWIKLDQPVPVHIEYYVTRVDGLGRAQFLADVYQLDTPRVSEVQKRLKKRREETVQSNTIDPLQSATSIAVE